MIFLMDSLCLFFRNLNFSYKYFILFFLTLFSQRVNAQQCKVIYDFSGADQAFVVPSCVTEITVKIWGAGGGPGDNGGTGNGGGGAYVTGTIPVIPGETLIFRVGQAGQKGTRNTGGAANGSTAFGGGGVGRSEDRGGGNGGGYSGVFRGAAIVAIAGGGGGAAGSGTSGANGSLYSGGGGGALSGNGVRGGDRSNCSGGAGGCGGSQVAGGACVGGVNGASLAGGNGEPLGGQTYGGGGGGGGYFGGEGGATGGNNSGGGGGGSSFIIAAATGVSSIAGSNCNGDRNQLQPSGNWTDLDNNSLFGAGGNCGTNSSNDSAPNSAQNGRIVIYYSPATPIVSVSTATCSTPGTATVSNFNGCSYSISPAGPLVSPGGVISGLIPGTSYTITVSNPSDGGCISSPSTSFSIEPLATPVVPIITTSVANCTSAGNATVSNYDPLQTYIFSPTGPVVGASGAISSMAAGTSYTLTASNGSCTSSASTAFSVSNQLPSPEVPLVSTTSSTCSANGTAIVSNYDPTITYTFNPSGPTINPTGNISGFMVGTSYTLSASNGSCSTTSASFVVPAQLITPSAPTISVSSESCTSDGTATISNYSGSLNYTFFPAGPSVGVSGQIGTLTYGTSYTVTASNGSCTSSASSSFSINQQLPTPSLSLFSQVICTPFTVDLTNPLVASTDIGVLSYFSELTYSIPVSNPTSVGAGTYYIQATSGTCTSNGTLSVSVTTTPTLNLNDQILCAPATVNLTDPLVASTDVGTITYFTDPALVNLVANPTSVGTGIYYLEATNGSCSFSGIINVNIFNVPVIDPVSATIQCGSFNLPAITGSNIVNESYWTEPDQSGTQYQVGDIITNSVTLYIFAGETGCSDQEIINITINPLPTVASFTGGSTYCQGEFVSPLIVSLTGTSSWTLNYTFNGVPQTISGAVNPINLGNAEGIYVLTSVSDANCAGQAIGEQSITINPVPAAPLTSEDTLYCANSELSVMTAVGGSGQFNWYTDAALTNSIGSGNSLLPLDSLGTSVYYVTETLNNCEGQQSSISITVNPCDIVIPSAFTPNGDLVNDVWDILNLDDTYPENQVFVFNRWGERIFESAKGNYASKPWDGKLNGTLLPVGSYFYILDPGDGSDKRNGSVSIIMKK